MNTDPLDQVNQATVWLLTCVLVSGLVCSGCVLLLLLARFLRIRFGRKVDPHGRAVLVTGATSGFGLATAKRLYKRGFTVFACYYNDQKAGYKELLELSASQAASEPRQSAESVQISGNRLFLVRLDVRSSQSIESAAREVEQLLDKHQLRLHCVMNNAATCCDVTFEILSSASIRNVVDTNLTGAYQVTKAFILRTIKDQGRVVNITSGLQLFPGKEISLYGSCKAALSYFSEALHEDLKPYGAACYTVVPGNFVLQTNIIYTNFSMIQKSVAQLSPEERAVYKCKIDHYNATMNGLLAARLKHSKEDPEKVAQQYGLELPDRKPDEKTGAKMNLFERLVMLGVSMSDGGARGEVQLDDTGAVDCFESAVVLQSPPRDIYAGNGLFQFVTGPIFNYLPKFAQNSLGNYMMSNLDASR